MHYTAEDIAALDKRKRTNFINGLSGVKSANLIGTTGLNGDNLAIVSSVVHIGADPALMGMIIRPHSVPRDTLENIQETGEFTINHVNSATVEKAHQTSARYPSKISEFDAVGLTPFYSEQLACPYVSESPLKIGLKLQSIVPIESNNTQLVIGEVIEVFLPDNCLSIEGDIDLESCGSLGIGGLNQYFQISAIGRFNYAKPDKALETLTLLTHD